MLKNEMEMPDKTYSSTRPTTPILTPHLSVTQYRLSGTGGTPVSVSIMLLSSQGKLVLASSFVRCGYPV